MLIVFCSVVSFHESLEIALQLANVPFYPHSKPNVHLIISGQGIFVHIWGLLCLAVPPHYEHVLTLILDITKRVPKICLCVSIVVTPSLVKIGILENCNIMKQTPKILDSRGGINNWGITFGTKDLRTSFS